MLISRKGRDLGYSNGELTSKLKGSYMAKKFTSKTSGLVMPMSHFTGKNVWILKPTSFNRGKGIHVVSDLKKLKKLIKEYSRGREQQLAPALSHVPSRNMSVVPQQHNQTS